MKLPSTMYVLERGWLSSNNIVFVGKDHTAVIDTGYATHAEQTLGLVKFALNGRTLNSIYNTHLHSDHCGGNKILQDHYKKVRTIIPVAEMSKIQNWDRTKLTFELTGQHCERFNATDVMHPGDKVRLGDMDWLALSAPGHDPHSVVFYCEKEGLLISADALWEKGFGVIFPEIEGNPGFAEARATLDMIGELDVRIVIPGHGKPFKDIKQALSIAHSRIDFLQADPARNAENAVKVLLKFLLLDRQQIKLSELPRMLHDIPMVSAANKYYLKFGLIHLAHWAVNQLRRSGVAEVNGDYLLNVN